MCGLFLVLCGLFLWSFSCSLEKYFICFPAIYKSLYSFKDFIVLKVNLTGKIKKEEVNCFSAFLFINFFVRLIF